MWLFKKKESNDTNNDIDEKVEKKTLILVLHNIACCFQKMKKFENCVNYLEMVILYYDGTIENCHKIKIGNLCKVYLQFF